MDIPWNEEDVALLKIFVNSNNNLQKELLKHADVRLIKLLTEIISNLVEGRIQIDTTTLKQLSSKKSIFRKIANPAEKRWVKKKLLFTKFAKSLLPLLCPIIFHIINSIS